MFYRYNVDCEVTLSVTQVQHPTDLRQGHEGDVLELSRWPCLPQRTLKGADHLMPLSGNLGMHTHKQ